MKEEIQTLSSIQNFFGKFISPCLWIVVGFFALSYMYKSERGGLLFFVFGICWLVMSITSYLLCGYHLKKVRIDKDFLYVSNYLEEIKISLRNVDKVEIAGFFQLWIDGSATVIINLKQASKFGGRIEFIPRHFYKRNFKERTRFFKIHIPVYRSDSEIAVDEIRQAIKRIGK